MSSYSYLSLRPPGRRLNRAASSVYNPLSSQRASPTPTPDYGQQLGGLLSKDLAPQFALGTPNGNSSAGFDFTNQGSGAWNPVSNPTMPTAAPGAAGVGTINYQNDPIYQQAQAFYTSQVAQAEAAALAQEKQNLIRYGDSDLISKVLGDKADQETLDAAKNNSFSTVQELGRWNTRSLSGIDSTSNRNNLFFSSTRGRDRGLQEEDMVRQQARTGNQLQDVLTGIAQGLIAAKSGAQAGLLGAAQTAYGNQLQLALAQMYGPKTAPAGGGANSYLGYGQQVVGAKRPQTSPYAHWYDQHAGGY